MGLGCCHQTCCCERLEHRQVRAKKNGFWARCFYLFERPDQFKKSESFYYAMLDWEQRELEGKIFWQAAILATNDPEADFKKLDRCLIYMNRCKKDWACESCERFGVLSDIPWLKHKLGLRLTEAEHLAYQTDEEIYLRKCVEGTTDTFP